MTLTVDGDEVIPSDAELSDDTLALQLYTEISHGHEIEVNYDNILVGERVPTLIDSAGNAMGGFESRSANNYSVVLLAAGSEVAPYRVLLSDTLLELEAGDSVTYTVSLSTQPSEEVMVIAVIWRLAFSAGFSTSY